MKRVVINCVEPGMGSHVWLRANPDIREVMWWDLAEAMFPPPDLKPKDTRGFFVTEVPEEHREDLARQLKTKGFAVTCLQKKEGGNPWVHWLNGTKADPDEMFKEVSC